MDNTNAKGQELASLEEYHGLGNSLMKKLSLLFLLASLMDLNGLNCNHIIISVLHIQKIIFLFSFFFFSNL